MTDQELFDRAASFLIKQGVPSVDHHGHCMYRGPNGLMCGAGCLIDNKHYDPYIEGKNAASKAVSVALIDSGIDINQLPLVRRIQAAHDEASQTTKFLLHLKENLRTTAQQFNLSFEETLWQTK